MRKLILAAMSCGLLAASPPHNEVPRPKATHPSVDSAELERLQALARTQQKQVGGLQVEVARLSDEVGRLSADLLRYHAQAEELRTKVAALEEASRRKGSKKELIGSWKLVSAEEGGVPQDPEVARLVFTAKTVTFQYRDRRDGRVFSYKLDPSEEPKEIDVAGGAARPTPGVYSLDGDRLTLCIGRGHAARPTGFDNRPGGGTTLWILEREGPAPSVTSRAETP
ncbi:MAG: TIGR03067 domain-containing protein [Planctomycetaceae bacterium]|nr:TIGR03067 domain-containing protein [Planctomycetaceae bacterium]MBV8267252.1 TIGR03067 domain-containing protein [Planctomycetaceae bacterium]